MSKYFHKTFGIFATWWGKQNHCAIHKIICKSYATEKLIEIVVFLILDY